MSSPDEGSGPTDKRDLFHRGTVSRLFQSNNMGLVRTEGGREIPFSYQFVVVLGVTNNPNDLREGQEIGYDLGWTSNGLRVTKIKTYD